MAAQRQHRPEPQRPALRLLPQPAPPTGDLTLGVEVVGASFYEGLRWGLVVSTLGFWLPVATALYVWLR